MENDVILKKMDSLQRCLKRIEEDCDLQDILCSPPGVAENLKRAVGFRNIAVREYEEINWEIVKSICTKHVKDFYQFMKAILKFEQ